MDDMHEDTPGVFTINLTPKIECKLTFYRELGYATHQYDMNMLCYDDKRNNIYKSVLYSYPENKLLSFAPPKSIPYKNFMEQHPFDVYTNVEEYIEGQRIQLFYDDRKKEWLTSINNYIGRKSETDHSVKAEHNAVNIDKLLCKILGKPNYFNVNKITEFSSQMRTDCCYSIIVRNDVDAIYYKNGAAPKSVYLVAVYKKNDYTNQFAHIPREQYTNWDCIRMLCKYGILLPNREDHIQSYTDVDVLCNRNADAIYVIVNEKHGQRAIVQTHINEYYADLMSYNALLQMETIVLIQTNRVHDYVVHFPGNKYPILCLKSLFGRLVHLLYNEYVYHYIKKHEHTCSATIQQVCAELHKRRYKRPYKKCPMSREYVNQWLMEKTPHEILYIWRAKW